MLNYAVSIRTAMIFKKGETYNGALVFEHLHKLDKWADFSVLCDTGIIQWEQVLDSTDYNRYNYTFTQDMSPEDILRFARILNALQSA